MQRLALEPAMVDMLDNLRDRIPVCTWIGDHIDPINRQLDECLQACHDCFHPPERRAIAIYGVPLSQAFGLDGLCNVRTRPMTILIDVGRVKPQDWLAVVAHEYAHAHLGNSGHDATFATILSHLCLGLGLDLPPWEPGMETTLRHWPPYTPNPDPLAFWRGQG